jgi:hypothetical protein
MEPIGTEHRYRKLLTLTPPFHNCSESVHQDAHQGQKEPSGTAQTKLLTHTPSSHNYS